MIVFANPLPDPLKQVIMQSTPDTRINRLDIFAFRQPELKIRQFIRIQPLYLPKFLPVLIHRRRTKP